MSFLDAFVLSRNIIKKTRGADMAKIGIWIPPKRSKGDETRRKQTELIREKAEYAFGARILRAIKEEEDQVEYDIHNLGDEKASLIKRIRATPRIQRRQLQQQLNLLNRTIALKWQELKMIDMARRETIRLERLHKRCMKVEARRAA